ncbi:MBL fold metallo-hydrolase [Microlunatus endophyticus]|nr:MBL fold metallo-hydrolase [Microlunatus endophyticus]
MGERQWAIGAWQQVADGVHRLVAQPAAVNIGLVVGPDAALLVDTGSSPEQGAALRAAAGQVTDKPVTAAVITHDHFDHAFGLAGIRDVRTIGHESLEQTLRDPGVAEQARDLGFDAGTLAVPETLIAQADVEELGGSRVVEIVHIGIGHTRGDLIATVTDPGTEGFAGVIFAGDLIESAGAPYFGPDSSVDEWSWTLDRLYNLARPGTIIVPGHGDPVDRDFVREQRDAVDAVRMEFGRLFAEGVPEAEALQRGDWPFPAEHIARVVGAAYAELREAAERQPGAGDRPTLPLA